MKKLVVLILAAALLLVACSTKLKADYMHEQFGRKAVEIADQFLDLDITLEEAQAKAFDLFDFEASLPSVEEGSEYYDGNYAIFDRVTTLVAGIDAAIYKGDTSKIINYRNAIAEVLGIPKR